jgi:hypothetical protein
MQWQMRQVVDRRPVVMAMTQQRHNLAVIYHHRGLVYERIGKTRQAQADLERARQLGYDPEKGVW